MSFRAVQNGPRVLILVNGRLAADLDSQTALDTARALIGVARLAQEQELAEEVTEDSALFLRKTGLGLAHSPLIISEAHKMAQWDSRFRRVPAIEGIRSAEKVGRPRLIQSGAK